MESSGLEFYTTKELIHELMRRKTFLGVVVHSQEEFKKPQWSGEKTFKVHFNSNIEVQQLGRLLETVAEYIDSNYQSDAH